MDTERKGFTLSQEDGEGESSMSGLSEWADVETPEAFRGEGQVPPETAPDQKRETLAQSEAETTPLMVGHADCKGGEEYSDRVRFCHANGEDEACTRSRNATPEKTSTSVSDDVHSPEDSMNEPGYSHKCGRLEGDQTVLPSSETTETFLLDDESGQETTEMRANGDMNFTAVDQGPRPQLLTPDASLKNVDDVLMELKFGWFQIKMLMLTGGAYFAMCAQIMCLVFLSTPLKEQWNLSKYSFSWLPFSTGVSGIVGGYVVGTLSDRFGRQKPFLISMIMFMVFGFASSASTSFGLLITLRAFVSMAIGGLSAINFVLMLEFLPRSNRGCFMVVITLCGALGAVLAAGLAWLLLDEYGWRVFLATCAIPSVFVVFLRIFINHESPRYLLTSNQTEKAIKVLKLIAKNNKTVLPDVEVLVDCPQNSQRGRIQHLFTKKLRRKTVFASFVWVLQSMGFWGVTIYLPEYMMKQGVTPYFSMFSIFIGEIPGLLLAMILIERHMFGRIWCLRLFSVSTCISLIAFALVNVDFLRAVCAVVCYFFMVPVYSILNTFTPEIYPTPVRSTAMAWMNIIIEIPSLVTPFVGETLLSSQIPWLYPVVWAACFFLQLMFSFGLRTETAGRNLDDISSSSSPQSDLSESTESNNPIKTGNIGCEVKLQLAHSTVSDNSDSIGCDFF